MCVCVGGIQAAVLVSVGFLREGSGDEVGCLCWRGALGPRPGGTPLRVCEDLEGPATLIKGSVAGVAPAIVPVLYLLFIRLAVLPFHDF